MFTFFFPQLFIITVNHFEPNLTGLAVKASRAPETVTFNIPKETKGAEKDDKDPKDLVSGPEQ